MNGLDPTAGVATGPAEGITGGPEGGSGGRAPEGTAGPSPAAGEAATARTQKYRYEVEYRRTRMGAVTDSIAICQTCRRLVEPVATELSRTGRHGTDRYEHEHPLTILVLVQSNSGRRSHYFMGEKATDDRVKDVIEVAIDAWEWYRAEFGDIHRRVKALLQG